MARHASLPLVNPTIVAALIAVTGTVVVAVTGFLTTRSVTDKTLTQQREQLDTTLRAQSEQLKQTLEEQHTRTLNERFATAASQLGSDVLCAYLRMPYEPDPGDQAPAKDRLAFQASREVRYTVIRVIAAHLRDARIRPGRALTSTSRA
jgi:hypothetical protein